MKSHTHTHRRTKKKKKYLCGIRKKKKEKKICFLFFFFPFPPLCYTLPAACSNSGSIFCVHKQVNKKIYKKKRTALELLLLLFLSFYENLKAKVNRVVVVFGCRCRVSSSGMNNESTSGRGAAGAGAPS